MFYEKVPYSIVYKTYYTIMILKLISNWKIILWELIEDVLQKVQICTEEGFEVLMILVVDIE